jgi:predicted nucleic acid-binding protein
VRLALDTNVMVYAEGLEFHADDRRKATLAVTLIDNAADHAVPIFDAVILASAVAARCDFLLSEDFHDGFAWRGVVVANPFGPSPNPRLASLLAA